MLSIDSSFDGIIRVNIELSLIVPKYRVPFAKSTKVDVSSRMRDYFSKR